MTMHVAVADAATTRLLRLDVLRGGDRSATPPGDADDAMHLAAYDGAALVGALALLPRPCPARPRIANVLQLRGMAVDRARQGQGVGALLLTGALSIAASRGDDILWCNARTSARAFYERFGMQVEGEEFVAVDSGLPHLLMWRDVLQATG